jgi:hypothetical protein
MTLPELPVIDPVKFVSITELQEVVVEMHSTITSYATTVDAMKADLLTLHGSLSLTIQTLNGICK